MRAIWKGNISFALVSIPISLFSATRRNELSFHHLHKKDMSPVSYKRFCATEDVEVPWEDITKGYEYEKGQYIEIHWNSGISCHRLRVRNNTPSRIRMSGPVSDRRLTRHLQPAGRSA